MLRRIASAILLTWCAWSQSFEVASIRPSTDDSHVSLNISWSRFTAENNSLSNLVEFAYDLKPYQVLGLPAWAESDRFDVRAKAEGDAALTEDLAKPMMQALLADRFQLKCHREMRELPVYGLVVAKGGPKLVESGPDVAQTLSSGGRKALNVLKVTSGSMAQLANQLSNNGNYGVDRPVFDRTGLAGACDYILRSASGIAAQADPDAVSVFTALQDQLGLKLEPSKASVEVLVIDRAARPSGN